MANCSSLGLRWRNGALPNTWSSGADSTCSMPSSSSGWIAENSSGSTPRQIRRQNGLRVKSRRPFPWDEAPHYLIRDRDRIYGSVVTRRLRAMGIRDKLTAPASPWQNGFAERLIGSIRREWVDHIIVLGEAHLRRILKSYAKYYNRVRTHRSLNKDCAGFSPGSANRCDQVTRHPGRTSSPLRPCLSFRYTQLSVVEMDVKLTQKSPASPPGLFFLEL
jgi:hypothetical protein